MLNTSLAAMARSQGLLVKQRDEMATHKQSWAHFSILCSEEGTDTQPPFGQLGLSEVPSLLGTAVDC